jgi:hypothetical protein
LYLSFTFSLFSILYKTKSFNLWTIFISFSELCLKIEMGGKGGQTSGSSKSWEEEIYWTHFQFIHFIQFLRNDFQQQLVSTLFILFSFSFFSCSKMIEKLNLYKVFIFGCCWVYVLHFMFILFFTFLKFLFFSLFLLAQF